MMRSSGELTTCGRRLRIVRSRRSIQNYLMPIGRQGGIVEFEQKGQIRAEYGKFLITRLAKDLTVRRGRGFSRSNLIYMRKFYLYFPKGVTASHLLSWSHYFGLCSLLPVINYIFPRKRNYKPNSTRCSMKLKMNKPAPTGNIYWPLIWLGEWKILVDKR